MKIMKNRASRTRLLALLSIYFIYKAVSELVFGNTIAAMVWTLISIIYIISIIVLFFVIKRWEKEKKFS